MRVSRFYFKLDAEMEQRLFISAAISFIRTRQQTITKNRREGTKCACFDPVLKSILTAVYCYSGASLCLVNFFIRHLTFLLQMHTVVRCIWSFTVHEKILNVRHDGMLLVVHRLRPRPKHFQTAVCFLLILPA